MASTPEAHPALLTAFLASSDARCPSCRYALRGCTSDKCPECGTPLELQVASRGGVSAWWVAGIVGLSMSLAMVFLGLLGMSTVLLNVLHNPGIRAQVRAGFASPNELPSWTPIVALAVLLLVLTLAISWLAARRERFNRLPLSRRAMIGLSAAASPLIVLGAIALIARWS
jgi:hypothetical protein